MNRQFLRYLQMLFMFLDLVVLGVVYYLCLILFTRHIGLFTTDAYLLYWTISNGLWIITSFILRTYTTKNILNFETFTKRTTQVYLIWIILIMFYLFFSRETTVSRLFILSTISGFGLGLTINRFIFLGINYYFRNNDFFQKKVLIVGFNETAKKLTRHLESDGMNMQIMGYVEDSENVHELSHYPVLAGIQDTLKVAREVNAQEIFSTISPEQNETIYDLMQKLEEECIRFRIVPNLSRFVSREVHVEYFGDLPVLTLRNEPLDDVGNRLKKRVLDVTISSVVIIFFLSWIIPILGILIFIESGGPVFFRQLRTGRNKKPFYCLKLRSMKPNKDADKKQATENDSRITPLGRFLRRTSLDELPQFFNVIKGEMSLVGPRPHMIQHTSDYSKIVNDYMVRQFVKPGITGWAQINGFRGEITNPEQIQMRVNKDIWYLENWTLWLDIKILFLTIYFVAKGDEYAY